MAEYIEKSEIYRRYFNNGNGVVRLPVSDIDVIPAADVAPVVHGRWGLVCELGFNDCYICYECGKIAMNDSNYCPNCGAKMDKEATDRD